MHSSLLVHTCTSIIIAIIYPARGIYSMSTPVYCLNGGTVRLVDVTKLLFAFSSLTQPSDQMRSIQEHFFIILSQHRTFSGRNSRKKNRSDNTMATLGASVHLVRNRFCYHFSLYQTNASCSQRVSRRLMMLRS